MARKRINVANPQDNCFGENAYLFGFGTVGTTLVLAYGYDMEDALEAAAEWLAEQGMSGHITTHDKGRDELGCDCDDPYECESHTYTEAGWLTSHEWLLMGERVTREEIIGFHRAL